MLAHNVYFSLQDGSAEARRSLVADCKEYLADHPGVLFFAAGTVADELAREVNDRDFDVALHVVFADKGAHDAYQEHPRHLEFIEKNRDDWRRVRVFDSHVEGV